MQIGQRLREVRVAKNLSQGDVEERTGLIRCYTSRVEHGYTIPSLETIEKYARAFEIPMYQLFVTADEKPSRIMPAIRAAAEEKLFGSAPKEKRYLVELCNLLGRMADSERALVFSMVHAMAKRKKRSTSSRGRPT